MYMFAFPCTCKRKKKHKAGMQAFRIFYSKLFLNLNDSFPCVFVPVRLCVDLPMIMKTTIAAKGTKLVFN